VAWGSGIAVAATLAAVFVFANLQGVGTQPITAGRGGAAESKRESTAAVKSSANYDRDSLAALAARLVQQGGTYSTDAAAPAAAPVAGGAGTPTSRTLAKAAATKAEGCLQRAAGVAQGEKPSYVEAAQFEGEPAFIGAFGTSPSGGTATQLVVVAVRQVDCTVLYLVSLPL
jgi:hypothetical protein